VTGARWFCRVGAPVSAEEVALIGAVSASSKGSGNDAAIEVVTGTALAQVLMLESHDNQWWDAEESERERLWDIAAERCTEDDLVAQLESAAGEAAIVRDDAARAAFHVTAVAIDPATAHAAADAARLALHQRALAELAAVSSDHWFRIKFALFESGRWPLGTRGGRFYLV
jgi:hypothetical protein